MAHIGTESHFVPVGDTKNVKGARNYNLDDQPILLINIFVDVGGALSQ